MSFPIDLRLESKKHQEKLKNIKVALFDADGILTTGHIYWSGEEVGFNRYFHTQDGYGLKVLMKAGIKVGVISGGDSVGLHKRIENLGLNYSFTGSEDKRDAFKKVLDEGYKASEILYMGDEFFDLPLLKAAGFSATVPNSSHEIQEAVDYVTYRQSGMGCVREVIDLLRYVQNIVPEIEELQI